MPSLSEYSELLSNLNLPPNSVLIELENPPEPFRPSGDLWDYQVFWGGSPPFDPPQYPRMVGNANEKYMSTEAQ